VRKKTDLLQPDTVRKKTELVEQTFAIDVICH